MASALPQLTYAQMAGTTSSVQPQSEQPSHISASDSTISELIIDGQTVIPDSAYYKSSELTSITIPASVDSIGVNVFDHCFKLTTIEVHPDNAHFTSIDGALYTKDTKTLLICPPGKKGEFRLPQQTTTIAPYAFRTCKKLTSIACPKASPKYPKEPSRGAGGWRKSICHTD